MLEVPIPSVERPARFVIEVSASTGSQDSPGSSFRAAIAVWPRVEAAERGKPIVSALNSAGLRLVCSESPSLARLPEGIAGRFRGWRQRASRARAAGVVFLGDVPAKEMNDLADLRGRWIVVGNGRFPGPGSFAQWRRGRMSRRSACPASAAE